MKRKKIKASFYLFEYKEVTGRVYEMDIVCHSKKKELVNIESLVKEMKTKPYGAKVEISFKVKK